jgi:hypothetical protein
MLNSSFTQRKIKRLETSPRARPELLRRVKNLFRDKLLQATLI